jgi:acetyl-CoA carboxylase alpha subunit
MGSIYGEVDGEVDLPIVWVIEHIGACVSVCAEITGIGNLSCTKLLEVTDPLALAEAIGEGLNGTGSSCGLGRNPELVLGKPIQMPAASS